MYLAQISSAEENDSSPQQKIGNSSKYSQIQSNPVLYLHSRAPSLGVTYFTRKGYSFVGLYYAKSLQKSTAKEILLESKIRETRWSSWCKNDHDLFLYTNSIKLNVI